MPDEDDDVADHHSAAKFDVSGARGVQIGSGNVQININLASIVRSAYLHQVRAFAPDVLLDREQELAELADFCTGSVAGDYLWWRASAWSGKTALMAWFVLHPPPETCIVSFFITARYAAYNERGAFLDVVIEQLAKLLGEPSPQMLTPATGPAHLWWMFEAAAVRCAERGQRLVLAVDGLDEDRATEHSIAALLPARPPGGMRVVVTSRYDPPLPVDVPSGHPLRDSAGQRFLVASPHAKVIREEANAGLIQLLEGSALQRDVLGFVVAAGGGLSRRDLVELTRRQDWQIERVFASVVGRAFTRRPAVDRSGPESTREVYLLSHEELQEKAEQFLGDVALVRYRARLRAWADDYRKRGWPVDTPEYLLRGYFRILHANGDLAEMVACALDEARHDRMVEMSGGDTGALAEITTTQESVLDSDSPDLMAMALLAIHYDALTRRNTNVPVDLPAVWVLLGQPRRAETQARSISDPAARLRATAAVIQALAETGDYGRAGELATELVVRVVAYSRQHRPDWDTLRDITTTLARAGFGPQAEHVARTAITDVNMQGWALWWLAEALAEAGQTEHAEGIARAIADPDSQQAALVRVARTLAKRGDIHRATMVGRAVTDAPGRASVAEALAEVGQADPAEDIARSILDDAWRANALANVARRLAEAGNAERGEAIARTITHANDRDRALADVAQALAAAGKPDRARATAEEILNHRRRAQLLAELAEITISAGDVANARTSAREAATAAEAITDSPDRAKAQSRVMRAYAAAGELRHALEIVQTLANRVQQTHALADIARTTAEAGHLADATEAAQQAEAVARSLTDPHARSVALTQVARAWAATGQAAHAEHIAESVTLPRWRAWAQADVVRAWTHAGAVNRASTLAHRIDWPTWRIRAFVDLARAWTKSTDYAEDVIRETEAVASEAEQGDGESRTFDPPWSKLALVRVARALVRAGEPDRADELAAEAERSARREHFDRLPVMATVARALAETGMADRAETMARDVEAAARMEIDPEHQARTLLTVAEALATAGKTDRADELARAAKDAARRIVMADQQRELLVEVAVVRANLWAGTGRFDRARELATEAETNARYPDPFGVMWSERQARLALVLAKAGGLARAERLARDISDPEYQVEALVGCADAWLGMGDIDRGEAVVRRMPDSVRIMGMAQFIRRLAAWGHTDRARALAREAEVACQQVIGPATQPSMLADVAQALAAVGEVDRATGMARKSAAMIQHRATGDGWEWVRDITEVAGALANVGDTDHARAMLGRAHAVAESMPDQFNRSTALLDVTCAYIQLGDIDRAETLAKSITDPHAGPGALVNVARAWAETGEIDQAERVVDSITCPQSKAVVLVDLTRHVGPEHAQRLVARALRPDGWQHALSALAEIRPDVLTAIADALVA